jgi:2C-methyl-D-erythritol 2,4-cyclodiphosphate synthase
MSTHQYNDMDNQPSFAERTKQLKEVAFQLKNAADVVLAEVQHMEAAQERFAQKATAKTKARA